MSEAGGEARDLIARAIKSFYSGDTSMSLALCREAAKLAEDDAYVCFEYSTVALSLDLFEEARGAALEAFESSNLEPSTSLRLGHLLQELGLLSKSVEAYSRYIERTETPGPIAYCYLANALVEAGNSTSGLEAIRKAIDLSEGTETERREVLEWAASCARKLVNKASTLAEAGDCDRALKIGNLAIEFAPRDPWILIDFGIVAIECEEFELAEEIYSQSCEAEPSNTDAWFGLGNACRGQDRLEEAVEHYQHSLLLEPKNYLASNNLGLTLNDLERYDEAKVVLEKALTLLSPEEPAGMLRCILGDSFFESGEFERAVSEYSEAVRLMPLSTSSLLGLTESLDALGRVEEARVARAKYEAAVRDRQNGIVDT